MHADFYVAQTPHLT